MGPAHRWGGINVSVSSKGKHTRTHINARTQTHARTHTHTHTHTHTRAHAHTHTYTHTHTHTHTFHRRSVRYLTNTHIQKLEIGEWFHPTHDPLFRKCGLFPMETYLERRRGTLRKYLETYRESLLRRAENCNKHCFHVGKVLWWDQPYLFKEDMDHSDFWYN